MVGSQIQGSILSRECDGDIYPTNNESTHETNDPLWSSKFECGKLPKLDTQTHMHFEFGLLAAWHPQTPASPKSNIHNISYLRLWPIIKQGWGTFAFALAGYSWTETWGTSQPGRCLAPQDSGTLQKDIQIHVWPSPQDTWPTSAVDGGSYICFGCWLCAIPIQAKGYIGSNGSQVLTSTKELMC